MTTAIALASIAALLATAVLTRYAGRLARSVAIIGVVSTAAGVSLMFFDSSPVFGEPTTIVELAPLFGFDEMGTLLAPFSLLALLAVLLVIPSREGTSADLSRVVSAGAFSWAGLLALHPAAMLSAFLLSAVPVWADLRARRERVAARVFFVHMAVSTALLATGLTAPGVPAAWAAPIILLAVVIREGLFPFHTWVSAIYARGSLGLAVLFTGAQLGAIAFVRFVLPMGLAAAADVVSVVALLTALLGASLSLVQREVRRALGYLVVSQSALLMAGLRDHELSGRAGSLILMAAIAMSVTGFSLTLAALEARRGPLRLDRYGGGYAETPALGGLSLMLGLAAAGLPGTLSFIGEDMIFHATLYERPLEGIAIVVATAMNGITVMKIFLRLFGGPSTARGGRDLLARERLGLVTLLVLLFALGIASGPVVGASTRAVLAHQIEVAR